MTEGTIATILDRVLLREGGASNDAADHGGFTNWGLTSDFLETLTGESWTTQKIANLSRVQALALYRSWLQRSRLDALPDDVEFADAVVDYAVNSGESRAIRAVQKAIGATVDGVMGPQTIGALQACSPVYIHELRRKILAARLRFLGGIITGNPSQAVFAAGWLHRLADQVEVI